VAGDSPGLGQLEPEMTPECLLIDLLETAELLSGRPNPQERTHAIPERLDSWPVRPS